MVTLGGFDTHGNQPLTHQGLLTQLSDSIKVFYDDLNYDGFDSKVLTMTFSEFGRRVNENGSEGLLITVHRLQSCFLDLL